MTISLDDGDDEGLALLIPDIQETTVLVQRCTRIEAEMTATDNDLSSASATASTSNSIERAPTLTMTLEQRYLEIMKALQFGMMTGLQQGLF